MRKRMKHTLLFCVALLCCSANSFAQPVVDGSILGDELSYGTAIAVQDTQTNFGDNTNPSIGLADGSELDQVFATVDSGILYLFIAGNLETNFNKLEIFFDTITGGQNSLRGDNPDIDFGGLNRMGFDGTTPGLTFDTGFASDYYLNVTAGDSDGDGPIEVEIFSNFAETATGGSGNGFSVGGSAGDADGNDLLLTGAQGVFIGLDNSNLFGVSGGTALSNGAAVDTGVEIAIPLALIGNPFQDFRVSAFINGSGHDFLSNQFLGGISSGDNVGEPRGADFNTLTGDQFVTVSYSAQNPADFDNNGEVNATDFETWQSNFGIATAATIATGDTDLDGDVDGADFLFWQQQFGFGVVGLNSAASVPEPSSVAICLLSLVGVGLARRRKMLSE